jgi:acetyltransferase-like isoleucine patch superfamily enzyme
VDQIKNRSPGENSLASLLTVAADIDGLIEPKSAYEVMRRVGVTEMRSESVTGDVQVRALGQGHFVWRGLGSHAESTKISIKGQRNTVFFGPFSSVVQADIRLSGMDAIFYFGAFSTDQSMTVLVEGPGSIVIGDRCMLSARIMLDRSDHHSIFDITTGQRINVDADILVRNHVWLGRDVKVNKGTTINEGTVVGQGSVVSGSLNGSSIYAGMPARILKSGITWSRVKAQNVAQAESSRRHKKYLTQLSMLEGRTVLFNT